MSAKIILRLVLAAVWMIVIYLFSDQPYSGRVTEQYLGDFNIVVRKAAHMFEYALMFWLFHWNLLLIPYFKQAKKAKRKILALSLIATFIYAVLDEVHQSYIAGRSACFSDVFVDMSGAALCCWLLILLKRVI